MDYTPKQLAFGEDGRQRLIDGIMKLSEAVKSTLGPSGNTVLIESQSHTSGMTVTKDGVTVAKSIDLIDEPCGKDNEAGC
jgi:chaperonin GroEL